MKASLRFKLLVAALLMSCCLCGPSSLKGLADFEVNETPKPDFPPSKLNCPPPSQPMPDGKTCRALRMGSATKGECPQYYQIHTDGHTCYQIFYKNNESHECPAKDGWIIMPDKKTCRRFTYVQVHKLTCPEGWEIYPDNRTCWKDYPPLKLEATASAE